MWQMLSKTQKEMGEDGKDYPDALRKSRRWFETRNLHSHPQHTSSMCCGLVEQVFSVVSGTK